MIPGRAGAPAAELHLIGTLAQDPDGPERLAGLLDELRPDAVAVEATAASSASAASGTASDASPAAAAPAARASHSAGPETRPQPTSATAAAQRSPPADDIA